MNARRGLKPKVFYFSYFPKSKNVKLGFDCLTFSPYMQLLVTLITKKKTIINIHSPKNYY